MLSHRGIQKAAHAKKAYRRVQSIDRVGCNSNKTMQAEKAAAWNAKARMDAINPTNLFDDQVSLKPNFIDAHHHGLFHVHADGYEKGQRDGRAEGRKEGYFYAQVEKAAGPKQPSYKNVLGATSDDDKERAAKLFEEIFKHSAESAFNAEEDPDCEVHQDDEQDLPEYDFDMLHDISFQALKNALQEHMDIVLKSDIEADKQRFCRDRLLQYLTSKLHGLACA